MNVKDFSYILDMDNGSLHIILNRNEVVKVNLYNSGTVHIRIDKDDNIMGIMIDDFAKYCFDKIFNNLYKRLIK